MPWNEALHRFSDESGVTLENHARVGRSGGGGGDGRTVSGGVLGQGQGSVYTRKFRSTVNEQLFATSYFYDTIIAATHAPSWEQMRNKSVRTAC